MLKILRAAFSALLAIVLRGQFGNAQSAPLTQKVPFKNMEGYVKYIQSHLKAPFDRDGARLPDGGAAAIMKGLSRLREMFGLKPTEADVSLDTAGIIREDLSALQRTAVNFLERLEAALKTRLLAVEVTASRS